MSLTAFCATRTYSSSPRFRHRLPCDGEDAVAVARLDRFERLGRLSSRMAQLDRKRRIIHVDREHEALGNRAADENRPIRLHPPAGSRREPSPCAASGLPGPASSGAFEAGVHDCTRNGHAKPAPDTGASTLSPQSNPTPSRAFAGRGAVSVATPERSARREVSAPFPASVSVYVPGFVARVRKELAASVEKRARIGESASTPSGVGPS